MCPACPVGNCTSPKELRRIRAWNWQKKAQLHTWWNAKPGGRAALSRAMAGYQGPTADFWDAVTAMAQEAA
eukprot:3714170-Alexandrium_andersonii.AAC.1